MAGVRRPFQGVSNILRFNWHFFALAGGASLALGLLALRLDGMPRLVAGSAAALLAATVLASLAASHRVYDRSGFYGLEWLEAVPLDPGPDARMANIHAGFDETSEPLRSRYPHADWTVLDFYDPARHTEVSIERARRAHPPSPDALRFDTAALPFPDASLDTVFLIFAAHEIRGADERRAFFAEIHRVLASDGQGIVVEHLRDLPNFLAYTLGFLHFFPRRSWLETFDHAELQVARTFAPAPLTTCFVLAKR